MDGLVFVLFFLALAIGFCLGRLRLQRTGPLDTAVHAVYLEGLHQLIAEQHDAALDTLISGLDVNETTVEMHFALGAFWRRKGEVERAIRIHQNLLDRTGLSFVQQQQAQFELALDYTKSGLLDRAEALLKGLDGAADPEVRRQALQELVYLYQDEREWDKAILQAELLCRAAGAGELGFWRHLQAHYCCELAEARLMAQRGIPPNFEIPVEVMTHLERATEFVRSHPRTLLLQTRLILEQGDADEALDILAALQLEESYLMVALPLVLDVYRRAGRFSALEALVSGLYRQLGSLSLIPVTAQLLCERSGDQAALEFVAEELQGREPLFLADLVNMLDKNTPYTQLKPILDKALPFEFQCEACGFEGRQFYWCCPTCKHWL
jgi:lipopolysaccharide biosynthesis regulator YciM